jgi:hypothetical protein
MLLSRFAEVALGRLKGFEQKDAKTAKGEGEERARPPTNPHNPFRHLGGWTQWTRIFIEKLGGDFSKAASNCYPVV